VEAESVVFIVCATAGDMNTSRYTCPYVADWSGGDRTLVAPPTEGASPPLPAASSSASNTGTISEPVAFDRRSPRARYDLE
jgi:hypothetical protein